MARFLNPIHSATITPNTTTPITTTIAETQFGLDDAIRLTRVRTSDVHRGKLIPYGDRDFDSLRVFLTDTPETRMVFNSGTIIRPAARAFQSMMSDLRKQQSWWSDHDLDMLTFDIPAAALERWRRKSNSPAFRLAYPDGAIIDDEVIEGFAHSVLPYLADPARAPRLFIDHILHSVCAYVARRYGAKSDQRALTGGLAPWQERRAKEAIIANLDAQVSLKTLADECRLSVSHFTKAFRQSTGQTPHQWLMQQRIDRAMDYLLSERSSLAAVAVQCGFSDQAHFTNTFTKRVGASPGVWRRQRISASTQHSAIAVGL